MSWLYGQTWLWYLVAFLVGILLAWLLLVRPQQRRLRTLEASHTPQAAATAGGATMTKTSATKTSATKTSAATAASPHVDDAVTEQLPPILPVDEAVTEQFPAVDPAMSTVGGPRLAGDPDRASDDATFADTTVIPDDTTLDIPAPAPAAGTGGALGIAGLAGTTAARSDDKPPAGPAAAAAEPDAAGDPSPAPAAPDSTPAAPAFVAGPYPGSALPQADGTAPTGDFTIKGNADSMLYHSPDSPYYTRTRAEAWFTSAEDAEAAGFTAYKNRKTTS